MTTLSTRHQLILDLSIQGLDATQIASRIGMTPQAIYYIRNQVQFQQELARRMEEKSEETLALLSLAPTRAKEMLEEASLQAAETQIALMSDDSNKMRYKSSKLILDRVFGTGDNQKSQPVTINIEQINLIREAMSEVRLHSV